MIYHEFIQETDGLTGSPHPFEEFDMPDNDEFESERNSDGDEAPESSHEMFDFS